MDRMSALQSCIGNTNVDGFPLYKGKVRDVYTLPGEKLAIVASDRISAFDHILKQQIPYKGQILNTIAAYFLRNVTDIIPTHLIDIPHPNVTIARKCIPVPIEVVIRQVLVGHSWRVYKSGGRVLCGVSLPEGLHEYSLFDAPILTPATKATEGHDEDISEEDILAKRLVPRDTWGKIRTAAFALFERGQQMAKKQGLLLADTKYEFGIHDGELYLIDEIHTPDSSRYFILDGYDEKVVRGDRPDQLSKEFVREWLMEQGFQGLEGQILPDMPDEFRWKVFERYSELFERITGEKFEPRDTLHFEAELENILNS